MNHFAKAQAAQKRAQALTDLAKKDGRELTAEEALQFDAAMAEFETEMKLHNEEQARAKKLADASAALSDANRPRGPSVPGSGEPMPAAAGVDVSIPNVLQDRKFGFKSAAEFLSGVIEAGSAAKMGRPFMNDKFANLGKAFDSIRAAAGGSTFVGEDGGFLIPPEFAATIFSRVVGPNDEGLPILAQCQRYSVRGNSLSIPALQDYDRSSTSYRNGGLIVYWPGEGGEITASKAKTRQIEFRTHKCAVLAYATSELIRQCSNYDQVLLPLVLGAIKDEITEQVMFGAGGGKPQGAFVSDACVSVDKENLQLADTIVTTNIIKMLARTWSPAKAGGNWYHNVETLPQLLALSIDVGTGGQAVYLSNTGIADAPPGRIFGRAAFETEHCLALGDAGDICFGNFTNYGLVTEGSDVIQTDMSIHVRFVYDEVAFRSTYMVDGKPLWDKPIVPRKGAAANTLSPFVKLAARA